MKAVEKIRLVRTVGDTDPFVFRLALQNEVTYSPISDEAQTSMWVKFNDEDEALELPGTARGDKKGIFFYSPGMLQTISKSNLPFEITVSENSIVFVIARGIIVQSPKVRS